MLHSQTKAYLEQMAAANLPPYWEIGPVEARQRGIDLAQTVPKGPEVSEVRDHVISGPNGDIPVRVFYPSTDNRSSVLVWFHGGGWVLGSVEQSDPTCRRLALHSGVVVISVDYRLAPEYLAPAAFDDSYFVTEWIEANSSELGINLNKLAVGGDSAGGNLAACVAMYARDNNGPKIDHQLLVYPVTDSDMKTASYEENAEGYGLSRQSMEWFWDCYAPNDGIFSRTDIRVSPAHASNFSDLPPAQVITAEYDPLRDEGEEYGNLLKSAGVNVDMYRLDGHLHGFFSNAHIFDATEQVIINACNILKRSFNTG